MKLIWIASLLLLPFLGSAQIEIEKGNWLLGGTASFSSKKDNTTNQSYTNYNIAPKVGYFITKSFALGLDFSFRKSYVSGNPFARYYYGKNFIQAKYLYKEFGIASDSGYDISLGRALFLKPNVAIEPELYYNHTRRISDLGMRIGFQFYW